MTREERNEYIQNVEDFLALKLYRKMQVKIMKTGETYKNHTEKQDMDMMSELKMYKNFHGDVLN